MGSLVVRFICAVVASILIPAGLVLAKVELRDTTKADLPKQEVDKKYSYREMRSYIPDNISKEQDSYLALSKFADKSLQNWWNTPEVQSATIARATDRTEKKLKMDVTVRGEEKKTDHRFVFNVGAVQGVARLKYSGYAKMEVRYESRSSLTGIELYEKFWDGKSLILGHYLKPQQSISAVGVRYDF